jgi:hypothetical protein
MNLRDGRTWPIHDMVSGACRSRLQETVTGQRAARAWLFLRRSCMRVLTVTAPATTPLTRHRAGR